MREINEYTAEVFRRSENRIKARKRKRNRMLAICIPLCLALIVSCFAVLPALTGKAPQGEELSNVDGEGSKNDLHVGSDVPIGETVDNAGNGTGKGHAKYLMAGITPNYVSTLGSFIRPAGLEETTEQSALAHGIVANIVAHHLRAEGAHLPEFLHAAVEGRALPFVLLTDIDIAPWRKSAGTVLCA